MFWRKWGALFCEIDIFPKQIMVFMVISKACKSSLVESNTKVNAKDYCNVLSKNMNSEMNRLVKQNEYLFMQCWARGHTAKLTLKMLKDKKQEPLITGAPSLATE